MDGLIFTEALGRQEFLLPFHSLAEKVELSSNPFLSASRSRRCLYQLPAKVARLFIMIACVRTIALHLQKRP